MIDQAAASDRYLVGLNELQRQAVEAPDGPLLIFAGAGSGKTRVLTHRIAHIIATRGVHSAEILAVTFTNKAAKEMRARLQQLLGSEHALSSMWLGTFHSLGVRLLRRDGDAIGIPSNFTIYDEADRIAALKRAMQITGIDEKRFPANRVVHEISAAKNEMLNPDSYAARAGEFNAATVARAYAAYETELRNAAALDFDDLLLKAVVLLRTVDGVREHYQERFRHVFVDEYQDTNKAQYALVGMLSSARRNLTVVGDDDQSIYGWRGADVRNILAFREDYPDATVVTLEQNYRSTQPILDIAHSVIRHNVDRAAKRLWTDNQTGSPVRLLSVFDEQEEALAVAAEIETLISREGFSLSDCAVLYRTNAQSRAFEDVMLRRGMPYRLVGGVRFYERREIKDVLAYLRLIANPRDPIAFGRIVNVPRRKIGDKTVAELERLARRRGISPFEAVHHLQDAEGIGAAALASLAGFGRAIDNLRELSLSAALPDFVEQMLRDTGYEAYLHDGTPEGDERWSNVVELIGLTAEYRDQPPAEALGQFLENVALVSDVDSLDETAIGVTLITLHACKGLEFPVVFLAGMEEGLLPHMRALEEGDSGIAEERRLTYVGVTRARQRLYLMHAFRRHLYGVPRQSEPSRFLRDIPEEQLSTSRRRGAPHGADSRAPGAVRQAVMEHAIRPNPVELPPQQFTAGARVVHARFGEGTILKSTMTRGGEEVVIRFDTAGMKIFAVAEAALRRTD